MRWVDRVQEGIHAPRVGVFLRVLSGFCLLGALSHLGSILGLVGPAPSSKPSLIRIADPVFLSVNLALAWGLWRTRAWAVFGWLAVVLFFQVIPISFLLVTDRFAIDPAQQRAFFGLLTTHAVLVTLFFLLLPRRK